MNALTPNTAAFLDSLTYDSIKTEPEIVSMPPSTFFPVPGRDTPEDSSPDSVAPKRIHVVVSDDSDNEMGNAIGHKRKASGPHAALEDDDDDDSLSDTAHDDKRQHNDRKSGGRRNSSDNHNHKSSKTEKGGKDTAMTKAQRRKEQNRAAQKAFRERREAKVRDLEQKVAELEAKSFGATVENENLRNILKRLQEENVALKQASFTFSMPVNGQPANTPHTSTQATPVNGTADGTTANGQTANGGIDWSQFSAFSRKPPSPPHSVSNDSLRSINDPSPQVVHRNSSGSGASPESLFSLGPSPDNRMPNLFGANGSTGNDMAARTAFQEALKRHTSSTSPNDQLSTPSSIGGTNKDDVEALFRSFYPNGIDSMLQNINNNTNTSASTNNLPNMQTQMPQYTFLTQTPGLTSQADTSSSNAFTKLFGDATSYRDSSNDASTRTQTANVSNTSSGFTGLANQSQWSDLTDNSVNDFLNSLAGNNKNADSSDLTGGADDEAFSRQLEALIAQSGGVSPESAFNLAPNNAFSPTNYLNMSPSPLRSLSNSQSPRSGTDATSPQSDIKSPSSFGGAMCGTGVVHILNEDGRVMRPSEVWTRMGMHDSDPQDLMIDDLCDQMKEKATCKDGKRYMKFDDVEGMMRRRAEGYEEDKPLAKTELNTAPAPTKIDPTLDPDLVCLKDEHGEYDPIACQAKLNEAFLKQNGLAI
ncbi:hypothetical protein CcaverHIS002_0501210 [Cutaneotrichosporon cavernicola]|nr:hypothetical protein CcaverHIS002_0501210 [Cutaneotrichosporon cavernicola]BEJ01439.1 hypothetical protein CcaverHIS631_0601210 [Cutaneotrichosporon cavernicola]